MTWEWSEEEQALEREKKYGTKSQRWDSEILIRRDNISLPLSVSESFTNDCRSVMWNLHPDGTKKMNSNRQALHVHL